MTAQVLATPTKAKPDCDANLVVTEVQPCLGSSSFELADE